MWQLCHSAATRRRRTERTRARGRGCDAAKLPPEVASGAAAGQGCSTGRGTTGGIYEAWGVGKIAPGLGGDGTFGYGGPDRGGL